MTNADTPAAAGTATLTPQGAAVAPATTKATTKASQRKGAPKAKPGKKAAPKPAKGGKPDARDGSKKAAVIQLLRRKDGATSGEIAKLTKWQPHTIRGFISGTVSKTMKLTVESVRNEQGERVYRVK